MYLHEAFTLTAKNKIPNKMLTATALTLVISSGYAVQRVLAHTKPNDSCGELIIFITINAAWILSVITDIQVYTFKCPDTTKFKLLPVILIKDLVDTFKFHVEGTTFTFTYTLFAFDQVP